MINLPCQALLMLQAIGLISLALAVAIQGRMIKRLQEPRDE